MKLYAYPFPSRAERIIWLLNELDLPCEIIHINPMRGEHLQPEFKAINPYGKVPVLVDGERSITESFAIAMYLCGLKSNDLLAATDTLSCLSHLMTEIEPLIWQIVKIKLYRQQSHPQGLKEYSLAQLQPALELSFSWLSHRDYCAGNCFSLADIWYYHLLRWGLIYGLDYPDTVHDYLSRISQRGSMPDSLKMSSH